MFSACYIISLIVPYCFVRYRLAVTRAYLKACNSKSTCIIRQCGNRNNEGAIWDMFIIELDGNFIVT